MSNQPSSELAKARELFHAGHYYGAELTFEQVLRSHPDSADAAYGLAQALIAQGKRRKRADQLLTAAVRLQTSDADTYLAIALALLDRRRLEDAVYGFRLAVDLRPRDALLRVRIADELIKRGQWEPALRYARTATQVAPDCGAAHWQAGIALLELSRSEEAARVLAQAAKQLPDKAALWGLLGVSAHHAGRCELSVEAFERAMQLEPSYFDDRASERRCWEESLRLCGRAR